MKVSDLKIAVPMLKPRDPNQAVLANKKNAGGAMRDKKQALKRGDVKHKGHDGQEVQEEFHLSKAPEAHGKFKELSIDDLADWLIKTRSSDMARINGSLQQQIIFNRKKNPKYADKMESTREAVKRKLKKAE